MASQDNPAPWKDIAARKQAHRFSQIPKAWLIPDNVIPQDAPSSKSGPQNVLSVPDQYLTKSENVITKSHTIPSLLSAISTRRLSAKEATTAFCHRAAVAHQLTNCITEPLFDSAIKRAEYLDDHFKQHGPIGPLHGLPVSVKDTFNITGIDSSIGIASRCFKPATSNAPLVDLLLSLGCVIVAKTNIPQTLASLDSVNNVFGRTMNPSNRLLTAGGSSGGEGVLVAMKGVMIGFGTDIGGSIRVPAMCNSIYGFKPSVGRLPYGGQQGVTVDGIGRMSVQATAGPIARSVEDIDVVMRELVPRARLFAEDCYISTWRPRPITTSNNTPGGSGPKGEFTVGVLLSDGNCNLLPPIRNIMSEISNLLSSTPGISVIQLPTPKAWTKSQSLMSKLMSIDGAQHMSNLISSTSEPLVPWMSTRFRTGPPRTTPDVASLQSQRSALEKEMLSLWYQEDPFGRRTRRLDAIICPLAPHPVPEIDRYNSVGYTSSWVLFDMPAACVPVRPITETDLELGTPLKEEKSISSWDEKCRELWDEKLTDRKVYLGSWLSVQVVVPKGEDDALVDAMKVVDDVARKNGKDVKARL